MIKDEAIVGEKTYGTNVMIQHATIGNYCSISPGCKIGLEEHHKYNYSTHPTTYNFKQFLGIKGRTYIEDHVWFKGIVLYIMVLEFINIID